MEVSCERKKKFSEISKNEIINLLAFIKLLLLRSNVLSHRGFGESKKVSFFIAHVKPYLQEKLFTFALHLLEFFMLFFTSAFHNYSSISFGNTL